MSRKRRFNKDAHESGRYVPVVVTSVVFGLAAGAVGMLMALAYADLGTLVPAAPTPQVTAEPRIIVDLPSVPDRDLSRSTVKFLAAKDASSLLPSSVFAAGTVLTSDGWVISYDALPSEADAYVARIAGDAHAVERVILDPYTGATFVKLDARNLPVAPFSRNAGIEPGAVLFGLDVADGVLRHEVIAVGTPPETKDADVNRSSERMQTYVRVTDAKGVVKGSPLTDVDGEVVAIVASDGEYGLLAVPIDRVLTQVSSVLRDGVARRPSLGVSYVDLSRSFEPGVAYEEGALLGGNVPVIVPGGAASGADLRTGDVIVSVNGERVTARNPLAELIAQYAPGDAVSIQYVRNGTERTAEIELGRSE